MSESRSWVILSSSSGKTFEALYSNISSDMRAHFLGYYSDRNSPGLLVAQGLLKPGLVHLYEKPHFEEAFLSHRKTLPQDLIVVLCGFFGILSKEFLTKIQSPVINLHPSLLPSFPGMDQKVHSQAFDAVPVSGFSVHVVNELLDGGPVLYQHPVFWGDLTNVDEARSRVRSAEQTAIAPLLDLLLRSSLSHDDRGKASRDVRESLFKHSPELKQKFNDFSKHSVREFF